MSEDGYVDVFVRVDRSVMTDLKKRLGLELSTEVMQEALTMINWAADEKMKGRVILSATEEGHDVVRLAMECLKKMTAQKTGRKPTRRDPVRAFINANPARGVSVAEIASATGMSQLAAEYAICYLCNAGEAVRMRRGRARLYFGSQAHADAYEASFPYQVPIRKKKGYGKTPARRKAIAAYMAKNPGGSAADVARGIGVAMETVRGMLVDMRRDGEAYAAGPATRPRWYASREAMDADQAAARAAEEVRKAAIVKHKARGGRACAAKKPAFVIVSKAPGEKSAAERARGAKEPPKIVGMDAAKITVCPPCDVERFRVAGPVVGGWAAMGVGRYLDSQS